MKNIFYTLSAALIALAQSHGEEYYKKGYKEFIPNDRSTISLTQAADMILDPNKLYSFEDISSLKGSLSNIIYPHLFAEYDVLKQQNPSLPDLSFELGS